MMNVLSGLIVSWQLLAPVHDSSISSSADITGKLPCRASHAIKKELLLTLVEYRLMLAHGLVSASDGLLLPTCTRLSLFASFVTSWHLKPVCIGDRGPNYFEVDIDVGSSKSAASVVGLVQGALKGLVIDMAITMEGHTKVTHRCMYLQTVRGLGLTPSCTACVSCPVWSLCVL